MYDQETENSRFIQKVGTSPLAGLTFFIVCMCVCMCGGSREGGLGGVEIHLRDKGCPTFFYLPTLSPFGTRSSYE